jgi:hypothetical protein
MAQMHSSNVLAGWLAGWLAETPASFQAGARRGRTFRFIVSEHTGTVRRKPESFLPTRKLLSIQRYRTGKLFREPDFQNRGSICHKERVIK